jgi:hypothetical protein
MEPKPQSSALDLLYVACGLKGRGQVSESQFQCEIVNYVQTSAENLIPWQPSSEELRARIYESTYPILSLRQFSPDLSAITPIDGERRKRSIHSTSNPYRFRFIEGWLEGEAFLRGFLAQVDDARPYLTCLTALFISDGRLLDPTPPGFECRHVSFGPL